jgi:hypothetical protein
MPTGLLKCTRGLKATETWGAHAPDELVLSALTDCVAVWVGAGQSDVGVPKKIQMTVIVNPLAMLLAVQIVASGWPIAILSITAGTL